jgi:hypothetical protein
VTHMGEIAVGAFEVQPSTSGGRSAVGGHQNIKSGGVDGTDHGQPDDEPARAGGKPFEKRLLRPGGIAHADRTVDPDDIVNAADAGDSMKKSTSSIMS